MARTKQSKNGHKPTSGKAWRQPREEGQIITLPSGNVVRLRPVALDILISSGRLPDLLTPIAAKTLWAEVSVDEIADVAEMAESMAALVNIVCAAAFLEPKVVTTSEDGALTVYDRELKDDEILLDDIDFADKTAVFQLATQPAEVLRLFREQQSGAMEAVYDGEGNEQPAE